MGQVATDVDIPEEAEAGLSGDALERARDRLDLGVVRGNAEADEAPGRRQAVEHVDLDLRLRAPEQRSRGVEPRRAGSHDRDAKGLLCAHRVRIMVLMSGSP